MNHADRSKSTLLAVFPGQGSQNVGMGKNLYENFAYVRELFEEASDSIRLDLRKLCFEGSETDLTLTENTQPCLLTASVAAFRVTEKEVGIVPGAVAGHSLGEYSALIASGSIPFAAAVRWVRERGLAMQKAVPTGEGTMAAVLGLDDRQAEDLCKRATELATQKRLQGENSHLSVPAWVAPANYNAPGQIVIAGSVDAVEIARDLLKEPGGHLSGKSIPLQVSAPFHCKLMEPARNRMAQLFSQASAAEQPQQPVCPYVPNRTSRLSIEPGLVFELLVDQIDHPVLWKQSIETLLNAGYITTIEFGPGKVLSGLIKRIASQSKMNSTQYSVGDLDSLRNIENLQKHNSHIER